ncbi:MAG TPA: hypothetical protein VGW38_20990 [Chloroflexota bacterium]|nr:hypothetical protein [Chloroflexota bacterium]
MTPRRRLEVYVAAHCATCAEARRLAKIADAAFHDVMVHVIDVDDHTDVGDGGNKDHNDQIVAVPTYILDGRVIALGNPSQEELFAVLAAPHASPA